MLICNLYENIINKNITLNENIEIIVITSLVQHTKQLSDLISQYFKDHNLEYTSDYILNEKQ